MSKEKEQAPEQTKQNLKAETNTSNRLLRFADLDEQDAVIIHRIVAWLEEETKALSKAKTMYAIDEHNLVFVYANRVRIQISKDTIQIIDGLMHITIDNYNENALDVVNIARMFIV